MARVTDRPVTAPTAADPDAGLTADELVAITGGTLLARSGRRIRGGAVDSRAVEPGNLFIALPGERTDGHAFVGAAMAAGAAAALVARPPEAADLAGRDATIVLVDDPLHALQAVASAWRRRFDPLVVGITGSIAKTSTKEAVAAVLGAAMPTLRNEGNLNNEIGLPLTVLRLRSEHRAAVLEMGMYVGGEIADLARIGRPEIGVVTAVQAVHLSRIGTLRAIADAKAELVEALPDDGVAVLNGDNTWVRAMRKRTGARVIQYGFWRGADVRAIDVEGNGLGGMTFTLVAPAGERPVRIPTLGRLSVHNATAAAAVGLASGLSLDQVVIGLERGWGAPHRVQVVHAGRGVTIIDDTYNASAGSMQAALQILRDLPGRRVAVLGEMRELGERSHEIHRKLGFTCGTCWDLLIVVDGLPGGGAAGIGETAVLRKTATVIPVADRDAARDRLLEILRPGDVVLVKASRGVALDVLVDELVAALGANGSGTPEPAP
jgi:UDP-N-acetylmuramoyl-tripeptide--D-alanyl-D-alanine ligase